MKILHSLFINIPQEIWEMGGLSPLISILWIFVFSSFFCITVFSLFYILFSLLNNLFLKYHDGIAEVVSHRLVPSSGPCSERYYLNVIVNNLKGNIQVSEKLYNSISSGNTLPVKYAKNRFTKTVSFKSQHI